MMMGIPFTIIWIVNAIISTVIVVSLIEYYMKKMEYTGENVEKKFILWCGVLVLYNTISAIVLLILV